MNTVEISCSEIDEPAWLPRCRRFVHKVLRVRGIRGWELSILLTGDRRIAELNRRYRGVDAATDVLAFPQDSGAGAEEPSSGERRRKRRPAGDIVISVPTGLANARQRRIPGEQELRRLLIHGILHLEGMDHPGEDSQMVALQEEILSRLEKEKVW